MWSCAAFFPQRNTFYRNVVFAPKVAAKHCSRPCCAGSGKLGSWKESQVSLSRAFSSWALFWFPLQIPVICIMTEDVYDVEVLLDEHEALWHEISHPIQHGTEKSSEWNWFSPTGGYELKAAVQVVVCRADFFGVSGKRSRPERKKKRRGCLFACLTQWKRAFRTIQRPKIGIVIQGPQIQVLCFVANLGTHADFPDKHGYVIALQGKIGNSCVATDSEWFWIPEESARIQSCAILDIQAAHKGIL